MVFTEGFAGVSMAFSGCLFSIVVRRRFFFSLKALLIKKKKSHKPPRANLTAAPPFFEQLFSKTIAQKQRPYAKWSRQGRHSDYCREKNQHYLSLIYLNTEKLFTGYKRSISHPF